MNIIEARGLGKRYGRTWALRDCSLDVPAGHVGALVGPNGAGKTTLLHMAVGLAAPSAGQIRVLGDKRPGSPPALAGIGFVAQDAPLYRHLSVTDTLHLARSLNRTWDQQRAAGRMADLGIAPGRLAAFPAPGGRCNVIGGQLVVRRERAPYFQLPSLPVRN